MNNNDNLLIKCPICGLENYHAMVLKKICAWCGYNDNNDFKINEDGLKLYQTLQVFKKDVNNYLWFKHNYNTLKLNKLEDDYLLINKETFNLDDEDIIEIYELDFDLKLLLISSIIYSDDIFEINYINGINEKSKNQLSFNKYDTFVYNRIIKHFKN